MNPFSLQERFEPLTRRIRFELVLASIVFGVEAFAVLPRDRRVGHAQDHGKLLPRRGRTGRAIDRLAQRLLEDVP